MRKILFLSTLTSFLGIHSLLNASTIDLELGWNLKENDSGFTTMENFNKNCIELVWSFDTSSEQWKAYSPNNNIAQQIPSTNQLTSIQAYSGFWVKSNTTNCQITLTTEEETPFEEVSLSPLSTYTLQTNINNESIRGVASINNYTYALTREGKLLIYDIAQIQTNNTPLKTIEVPEIYTHHLKIIDNYLYITGSSNLLIYNISDVLNPTLETTLNYMASWNEPSYSQDILLINKEYDSDKINLFDITDKAHPTHLLSADLGKSVIYDNIIYSVHSNGNITKYQYDKTLNSIEPIETFETQITDTVYNIYFYNNKLVVITQSTTSIFDTQTKSLLKEVYGGRSSGCYENFCSISSTLYDLDNLDSSSSLNTYASTVDGFPFQVNINPQGYILLGSQQDVKVIGYDINTHLTH